MKDIILKFSAVLMLAATLCGCGGRQASKGKTGGAEPRPFPTVKIPAAYSDEAERFEYAVEHFWDAYAKNFEGVHKDDVESAVGQFVTLLDMVTLADAQKGVKNAFDRIEASAMDSTAFWTVVELVEKYLYDPNSPARNEDYYLPWVKGLSTSPRTADNMRASYGHTAEMCALNQRGFQAPDFVFCDLWGRYTYLYDLNAAYTVLFFSNPGCNACRAIIDEIQSRPYINDFISKKVIAVVNVYIDDDLEAWRSYADTYPTNWLSGYDPEGIIRTDCLYNVRAIPSLYLLDADKRVLMKDAPTEKVLEFLDKIAYGTSGI